ncbi:MAG TPA: protein kinase [Candidatus Acidoferrales bacterium]
MPVINDDTTILGSGGELLQGSPIEMDAGGLKASLDALQARLAIPARYEVIEELGRGGMGIVYKVRDIETCEIVAIKILKPEIAADPFMRENLRKEVCMARKVTHKNVCRIYEFSRSETTACISMEYVAGESLLSKLQRRGALAPADAVDIARQICAGLREAHEQGIVHRDLKPANIVIALDKAVKIMDFGVARRTQDTTQTETLAGTPAYMSPEQLEMKTTTSRTDIYALGLMLYEMLTGTSAFSGDNAIEIALQQIRQQPTRPSTIVPTIPARLDAAVLKCLEKDPEERFVSIEELSSALEKAIAPVTGLVKTPVEYKYFQAANATLHKVGRAAFSDAKLLRKEFEHGARKLNKATRPRLEKWLNTLRAGSLRGFPNRRAQFAMFGAALFTTAVVFGFAMREETHAEQRLPATNVTAMTSPSTTKSAGPLVQTIGFEPPSPFSAKEFEFDASPPTDATSEAVDDKAPDSDTVAPVAKAAPTAHARPTKRADVLGSKRAPSAAAKTQVVAVLTPVAAPLPDPALTNPASLVDPNAGNLAPLQPAQAPDTSSSDSKSMLPQPYLEVGSFNDQNWADDAVSQLTHLGFTAFSAHKTHLWMQSYRVEVGPFKTVAALEAAETSLEAKGFNPHAVK